MLKILILSIPILFLFGCLFHFLYKFSYQNKLVGLFAPINESIFEHTKLLLTPLTLFWVVLFFILKDINYNSFFLSMLISIVVSIITMIAFFYTYKGIIGNNYLLIDVLDLLISLIIGQIISNHVYVYSNNFPSTISIIIIFIIHLIYIYFTFCPLKIPFFFDAKDKTYGINKNK